MSTNITSCRIRILCESSTQALQFALNAFAHGINRLRNEEQKDCVCSTLYR